MEPAFSVRFRVTADCNLTTTRESHQLWKGNSSYQNLMKIVSSNESEAFSPLQKLYIHWYLHSILSDKPDRNIVSKRDRVFEWRGILHVSGTNPKGKNLAKHHRKPLVFGIVLVQPRRSYSCNTFSLLSFTDNHGFRGTLSYEKKAFPACRKNICNKRINGLWWSNPWSSRFEWTLSDLKFKAPVLGIWLICLLMFIIL